MKIVQIASHFGKTSVAYRLNTALNKANIHSNCAAYEANGGINIDRISRPGKIKKIKNIWNSFIYKKKLASYKNRDHGKFVDFRTNTLDLKKYYDFNEYDIIHLHWITGGMLELDSFSSKKEIVWTFHGVWPITGGCHLNYSCEKWKKSCGACPQLGSDNEDDLSYKCWSKKFSIINQINNLTIITPSKWLGDMIKQSSIFEGKSVYVLPNCIDTNLFMPKSKKLSRDYLKIPKNARVLLFNSANINDYHKGFDLLLESLNTLKKVYNLDLYLLAVGASNHQNNIKLPYPVKYLGYLNDEISLVLAYNSADIFVGPSRQDNLPTTFIEATACGIPAVGFRIGGIPEIIEHKKNGYLADPFDTDALAKGIHWLLSKEDRYSRLSKIARMTAVERYSMERVSKKHIELYKKVLN